jgi:membrane-associated phospholipid phosphatase
MDQSLANAISLTLLLTYIIPMSLLLYTQDVTYLFIGISCFLIGTYIERIKPLFDSPRPEGAMDCNAFCSGGLVEGQPGFPSGHVATVTLFVLLMGAYTQSYYWLLGIIWIGFVGWSRYEKRCHSVEQIGGGVLTGAVGAAVAYMAYWVFKTFDCVNLIISTYSH